MNTSIDVQSENLALVTLKERCHLLKQQLMAADEENTKLKVQMRMNSLNSNPVDENAIAAEVERLKKEKEQLSNQVHILATENTNMWSRLSRLTVVNRNLTRRFTAISDKLEKYGISSLSESETEGNASLYNKDYRKNLEDMSLKLINSIKLEKTELEKQYAQMVDLHKNDVTVPGSELAFSSLDVDADSVVADVRKHAAKLNQLKHSLNQQQTMLISAVTELKKFKEMEKSKENVKEEDNSGVSVVDMEPDVSPAVPSISLPNVETEIVNLEDSVRAVAINPTVEGRGGENEQVCPMCSKHIPGDAKVFVDHVTSHFDDGESDSLNSFVHIP